MTALTLALTLVACIGWTLHARVLHRALREARDEVAALEKFTRADYQRERTELERRFLTEHGICAEDIGIAILRGVLPWTDPLVAEWVALLELSPYVSGEAE